MDEQVEYGDGHPERAQGQHHQAQVADRRVSQDALQVVHHQRQGAREGEREQADHRDEEQDGGRHLEQGHKPGDQEHARGNHRGGVDQRADGRRPLHSVGQPDVERELRRLAHRTQEHEEHRQVHCTLRDQPCAHPVLDGVMTPLMSKVPVAR